jgi:hypothetical protein
MQESNIHEDRGKKEDLQLGGLMVWNICEFLESKDGEIRHERSQWKSIVGAVEACNRL